MIKEETVLYSPIEKAAGASTLIDRVLTEWESDKEGGFEKAMQLFKQQLNEQ